MPVMLICLDERLREPVVCGVLPEKLVKERVSPASIDENMQINKIAKGK